MTLEWPLGCLIIELINGEEDPDRIFRKGREKVYTMLP